MIKQIIPCAENMKAVFSDIETGEVYFAKVLGFSLSDDGFIRPFIFDAETGVEEEPEKIENFRCYIRSI